jgi:hypothetical protein
VTIRDRHRIRTGRPGGNEQAEQPWQRGRRQGALCSSSRGGRPRETRRRQRKGSEPWVTIELRYNATYRSGRRKVQARIPVSSDYAYTIRCDGSQRSGRRRGRRSTLAESVSSDNDTAGASGRMWTPARIHDTGIGS